MRRRSFNFKNLILQTACILLVMVLVSTMMVSRLYARYTASGSSSDGARTAAFVFVAKDSNANSTYLNLSGITKPGDKEEYTFTVSNFSGNSVSETALDCIISLQLNGSMPLKCTITDNDDSTAVPILSADMADSSVTSLPLSRSKTISSAFQPSQKKTYTYTLTVEWSEAQNDAKYASRSAAAEVILTVSAQQVD